MSWPCPTSCTCDTSLTSGHMAAATPGACGSIAGGSGDLPKVSRQRGQPLGPELGFASSQAPGLLGWVLLFEISSSGFLMAKPGPGDRGDFADATQLHRGPGWEVHRRILSEMLAPNSSIDYSSVHMRMHR